MYIEKLSFDLMCCSVGCLFLIYKRIPTADETLERERERVPGAQHVHGCYIPIDDLLYFLFFLFLSLLLLS